MESHTNQPGSFQTIGNPQDLPSVVVSTLEEPRVKEPSLPMIGFRLSRFVLFIISGFLVILTIILFAKQFDASGQIQISPNASESSIKQKLELFKLIQEEKKNYRDFIMQISQMVLLNLLLPVLTAILGYIFASNKNKEE